MEKLLDISKKLAENRMLEPLLKYAMGIAIQLVEAEKGFLVLINDDGSLEYRVRQTADGIELPHPDNEISHSILEKVITTRQAIVLANASGTEEFQRAESVTSLRLRSVMCVPLISYENILGAIYVENRREIGIFTQNNLQPLEYFAAHASVAINNAMLNDQLELKVAKRTSELRKMNEQLKSEIIERRKAQEKLKLLSITDYLTGAFNRRHFFDLALKEMERVKRYNRNMALILLDADHFKKINDTYGHLTGDHVLKAIAKVCQESIRQSDILARFGGEEFIILLPETEMEAAVQAANRIREAIENLAIPVENGIAKLTVSLGVSEYDQNEDTTLDQLIDQADKALYHAKDGGRNDVSIYNPAIDYSGRKKK